MESIGKANVHNTNYSIVGIKFIMVKKAIKEVNNEDNLNIGYLLRLTIDEKQV